MPEVGSWFQVLRLFSFPMSQPETRNPQPASQNPKPETHSPVNFAFGREMLEICDHTISFVVYVWNPQIQTL